VISGVQPHTVSYDSIWLASGFGPTSRAARRVLEGFAPAFARATSGTFGRSQESSAEVLESHLGAGAPELLEPVRAQSLCDGFGVCGSSRASVHVLSDPRVDHPLTDPGTAGCRCAGILARPGRQTVCCLTYGALRHVNSPFVSLRISSARARGLRNVPSRVGLCPFAPRTSPAASSPHGDTGCAGRARRPGHAPCLGCGRGRRPLRWSPRGKP
jgi:hypothetical protein